VSSKLRVAILGSTGSIGRQALQVAEANSDRIEVVALAAHTSAALLAQQAIAHGVRTVAISSPTAATQLKSLIGTAAEIDVGPEAIAALAVRADVDVVLNALVGAAGLRATVAALTAGKTLALANKESLVVGGELVMGLAKPGKLLPVDSEHSAIFQCYQGENAADVSRIWLTASGGPFRGRSRDELKDIGAEQALAHPTWTMGPKITIDSATLMNKGLEVIEAHHLFGVSFDQIRVVVHPQSCVHSMVEFSDGSVKAHLGATDMRIPIQYAFSYPRRWEAPIAPVDFARLGRLDFAEPDLATFGCLRLAIEAGRAGGTMPCVLNAANEVAVAAFLAGECSFLSIEAVVAAVLEDHNRQDLRSIEQLEEIDRLARNAARVEIRRLCQN
jgi:1-deoxy-D-xylulose-5-phosphate reductoisomerase